MSDRRVLALYAMPSNTKRRCVILATLPLLALANIVAMVVAVLLAGASHLAALFRTAAHYWRTNDPFPHPPSRDEEFREAVEELVAAVYGCGSFSNGVTDPSGSTDEGEVHGWAAADRVRRMLP